MCIYITYMCIYVVCCGAGLLVVLVCAAMADAAQAAIIITAGPHPTGHAEVRYFTFTLFFLLLFNLVNYCISYFMLFLTLYS